MSEAGAAPQPNDSAHGELTVDLAAFLPEGVAVGEPSPEPAGTDPGALDQIEADLAGVDAALVALDGGTYGTCTTCGDAIDDGDLSADPVRTACAAHA